MPDTMVGERRYNVVEHIRLRRVPVLDKESGQPVMEWVRTGTRGQRVQRVKMKRTSVSRVQLESYDRQERKRLQREHGITSGRQWRRFRKELRRLRAAA